MHVHVGALSLMITAAEVIIILFLIRWVAATWPESAMAKALAALN